MTDGEFRRTYWHLVKAVNDEHEIMLITTEGVIIQLRAEDISILGRITSGVKLINLDEGVKVAQIAKVREKVSDGSREFEQPEDAMEEIEPEENDSDDMTEEELIEEGLSEAGEDEDSGEEEE